MWNAASRSCAGRNRGRIPTGRSDCRAGSTEHGWSQYLFCFAGGPAGRAEGGALGDWRRRVVRWVPDIHGYSARRTADPRRLVRASAASAACRSAAARGDRWAEFARCGAESHRRVVVALRFAACLFFHAGAISGGQGAVTADRRAISPEHRGRGRRDVGADVAWLAGAGWRWRAQTRAPGRSVVAGDALLHG